MVEPKRHTRHIDSDKPLAILLFLNAARYAIPDKDCLYNVYMMDETHSVFAVGAGGVTRLKNQDTGKIERIYNYKYPYEYIDRFDEILKRKDLIKEFYIK